MPKTDLRIIKTERDLRNGLDELIKTIPFTKLSVNQICEHSLVHRTTFYKHFHDKEALLAHYLAYKIPDADTIDIKAMVLTPFEDFGRMFAPEFAAMIQFQYTDTQFYNVFTPFMLRYLQAIFDIADVRAEVPNAMLAHVFGGELFGQLYWRLTTGQPTSPDEMDRAYRASSKIPTICGLA